MALRKIVDFGVNGLVSIICVRVLADNYSYIIQLRDTRKGSLAVIFVSILAILVDPVEPQKLLEFLDSYSVEIILVTHHHVDHAGGNDECVEMFPQAQICGFDHRIPRLTRKLQNNEAIVVGSVKIIAIHTPCHTTGSLCYYMSHFESSALFSGDTLFLGGCGRFFEGTAEQMLHIMVDIIGKLPGQTLIFPGHEYTIPNLKFSVSIERSNQEALSLLEDHMSLVSNTTDLISVPWTLDLDSKVNPFRRIQNIMEIIGEQNPSKAMAKLRELKNAF